MHSHSFLTPDHQNLVSPYSVNLLSNYSETSLSMLEGPACQLLCEQFCGEKYAFAYVSGACIQDK